jgi:hypothetical protein
MTKSVNRRDACDFIAAVDQSARMACKRCDVARYPDHDGNLASRELPDLRLRALPRRIEDHRVLVAQFVRSVCGFKATAQPKSCDQKMASGMQPWFCLHPLPH